MNKRWPTIVSFFILASVLFPLPSPVRDAVTEQAVRGFHLQYPISYVMAAPFCALADFFTILSLHEWVVLLIYCVLWLLIARKPLRTKIKAVAGGALFLLWGILLPRPMARLVADDSACLLMDFHSHTSYSHDGRPSFTPLKNMLWHERLGYDATFITDHNQAEGAQEACRLADGPNPSSRVKPLEGEEVSLFNTHLGVLGNPETIPNGPYDSSYEKIPAFIEAMHRKNYLVVAHLPEYWREHWRAGRMDFLSWKVDGFEIVNDVPYCLDFPLPRRREIIAHCRQNNLFVTGVTDNHGYGYSTAVWSVMRIPGWEQLSRADLQKLILRMLHEEGFNAVQVLEREKYFPENVFFLAISPLVNLWMGIQALSNPLKISCIFWIWSLTAVFKFEKDKHS